MVEALLRQIEQTSGTTFEPKYRAGIRAILETTHEQAGVDAVTAVAEWISAYDAIELSAIRGYAIGEFDVPISTFPEEAYPDV